MYYYPATFIPHPLQLGRYDVTFVDFPGCVTSGDNLGDALRMAQEALTMHLGTMLKDGDDIPSPSSLEAAKQADESEALEENDPLPQTTIWQYILINPVIRKNKSEAPVRLSISLKPSVIEKIDIIAEDMGISRSGLINVAAREYINRMQE